MVGGPAKLVGAAAGVAIFLCLPASASAVSTLGDFNGDGRDDLAVHSAGTTAATSTVNAGHVNVLYGAKKGLTSKGNQLFHQESPGVPGEIDPDSASNEFGSALAAGDFNGDGRDELAVAAKEYESAKDSAGRVIILEGSANGLVANNESWDQDSSGIQDTAEVGDEFGFSLATGDFDADGVDDLAIGVRGESCGANSSCGAVATIQGDEGDGLTATDNALIGQETADVEGVGEASDQLGYSVAVGDFDGDTVDDVAAGAPGEDVGADGSAGAVNVLYGDTNIGLVVAGDQIFDENDIGGTSSVAGNLFGNVLAAGDFDSNSRDDLAIGAPGDGGDNQGSVAALYGTAGGLATTGSEQFRQGEAGVPDTSEPFDEFGEDIAAGDLNGDGAADLAAGAYGETVSRNDDGAAYVLYGSTTSGGLSGTGSRRFAQKGGLLPGDPDTTDHFGWSVTIGNFNNGAREDLAIGAVADRIRRNADGSVTVVFSPAPGNGEVRAQLWHRDKPGIKGTASKSRFGSALSR